MCNSALSPQAWHLNGECLSNWNHDAIWVGGKISNISSATFFYLCSYIIIYNKQVLYLAKLKFIYEVLMNAKCQIVESGLPCSFGSHLNFLSMFFQFLSFSLSTLIKYIDTIHSFRKLRIFVTSHTKPSQALQVLQEVYVDIYNQPFICSNSFTSFLKKYALSFHSSLLWLFRWTLLLKQFCLSSVSSICSSYF